MKIKKRACDANKSYFSKTDWLTGLSIVSHVIKKKKEIVVNTRAHNFIQLRALKDFLMEVLHGQQFLEVPCTHLFQPSTETRGPADKKLTFTELQGHL